jgi:large subunit ribosomal protein L35
MPKMKTHSATKKRFHVTGTGKVTYQKGGRRHNFMHKNAKRLRRLRAKGVVSPQFEKMFKKLLPYA